MRLVRPKALEAWNKQHLVPIEILWKEPEIFDNTLLQQLHEFMTVTDTNLKKRKEQITGATETSRKEGKRKNSTNHKPPKKRKKDNDSNVIHENKKNTSKRAQDNTDKSNSKRSKRK